MRGPCRIPKARCERYIQDGLTIREIAAREGWSARAVGDHLRGLGLSRSRARVTLADVLAVVEGRETVRDVRERLGVSRAAVHQRAHREGIWLGRRRRPGQLDLFGRAA